MKLVCYLHTNISYTNVKSAICTNINACTIVNSAICTQKFPTQMLKVLSALPEVRTHCISIAICTFGLYGTQKPLTIIKSPFCHYRSSVVYV